jgi:myo-inositol 2-dehydrogenase / D-chiro-inositol 1-dehydrogenase
LHTDAVLGALKRNVHVFSEKPMATSLHEAKQIVEAASHSKGIYQIGFNRRFAPVYKFARKQIGDGFHPYSANIKMNRGELINPQWVCNRAITGGFLYESTIHLLDMMRWLMGEVVEVQCKGQQNICAEMDDFAMILTFASGHFAAFSSSAHTSWAFPFERIELYGGHSSIVTEEMEKVVYSPGLAQEIVLRDYFQLETADKWGYREEDRLFIDAIVKGQSPAVTADDGYKAVELVEACYQSAAMNGAPVKLPLS